MPAIRLTWKLKAHRAQALLVSLPANVSYLAKTICRDSYILLAPRGKYFITDFRYLEEAKAKLGGAFQILNLKDSLEKTVGELCAKLKIRNLGFEEEHLSFFSFVRLRRQLKPGTRLIPLQGMIEAERLKKEGWEIKKVRRACNIAMEALRYCQKIIAPGKSEKQIRAEVEHFMRLKGAEGASFDTIVASGPNSSYPHHLTSERKLRANEPVLIDLGVDYQGYKSDLTRVFFLGKISPLVSKIYRTVVAAQAEAIRHIRPGIAAGKIDFQARDVIARAGYACGFGHSLGHGVGLQVHEAPRISAKDATPLACGMCFTVEPAIYLPGKFGIRIEDMVLVTSKGASVLSGSLHK